MRTIKQVLIILLVLLGIGYIATGLYQGFSDHGDPPTISCSQDTLEISTSDDESVLLTGVTASDPQDGDLTAKVIVGGISKLISADTAKVTYLVFDSDDNMGTYTRYIRYTDYRKPQFAITAPLVYSTTESVAPLERLTATDVVDGDISERIRVSTLSPTSNTEIYEISIQVSNSVGDLAWLKLPVIRLENDPLRPTITLSDYLVYLEQGSEFDPFAYLTSLDVPQGEAPLTDVVIDNPVDTGKADTYQVYYTYTSNGSMGTAILTVVVQ